MCVSTYAIICLDTSNHFSVLPSKIFFIFLSTLVLTSSIDVVFTLSTKLPSRLLRPPSSCSASGNISWYRSPVWVGKTVLDKFLVVWTADYTRNLPPWMGSSGHCQVKTGSVVLAHNVNQPCVKWPLGIVTQMFTSWDGMTCTINVKMVKDGNRKYIGKLIYSLPRIHDLEVVRDGLDDIPW